MTSRLPPTGQQTDQETAQGMARLEGYLLCQAELRNALAEGEDFARRMPWLTTAQHEDVARHYAEERLALSKEVLRAVTARCAELRSEYTARYQDLQQRLVCMSVASMVVSAALFAGAWLVSGYGR